MRSARGIKESGNSDMLAWRRTPCQHTSAITRRYVTVPRRDRAERYR